MFLNVFKYTKSMSFYETELRKLGLTGTQIENVLSQLSVRDIEKFIAKFKSQHQTKHEITTPDDEDAISLKYFGEPKNIRYHEIIDLEKKFRRLALKLHPDRCGGDVKPFHALKKSFEHEKAKIPDFIEDKRKRKYKLNFENVAPPTDALFDNRFDNNLFNKHFEKNSFKEDKIGHADWLKNQKDVDQGPRPSETNFNSAFENHKKESIKYMTPKQLQIVKTTQLPQELVHQKGTLIGGDESDEDEIDFTGVCEGSKLQFSDIRKALEITHLIDASDVKDFNVKNKFTERQLNQGSVERMTKRDIELYEDQKQNIRDKEENRKYRAMIHDENVDTFFRATQSNRLTYD